MYCDARSLGCILIFLLGILALPCQAGSLRYCDNPGESSATAQDRLIRVAALVKAELDRSGESVALVARSGLALQWFDQRYSHAGVSLRDSPNAPWSVRQLYYACDEARPRIFDQGMSGFVLGMNDPSEGFISIVLMPPEAASALERTALDGAQALQLLGATYSANAYAFSTRYQNCNQWLAELLATAWAPVAGGDAIRQRSQEWLQDAGYSPSVIRVGWQPLMWLADRIRWLHSDDHPATDLEAAQFRVSLPQSIETWVHTRHADARRIELCYTEHHIVVRRGWDALEAGCTAGDDDELTLL